QIATDQQLRERGALHGIEARRAVEAADLARDLFEGSPCLVGTESDGRPGDLIGHSVNSVLSDRASEAVPSRRTPVSAMIGTIGERRQSTPSSCGRRVPRRMAGT